MLRFQERLFGGETTGLTVYLPGLKSHFNSLLNAWVLIPPIRTRIELPFSTYLERVIRLARVGGLTGNVDGLRLFLNSLEGTLNTAAEAQSSRGRSADVLFTAIGPTGHRAHS